MKQSSKPKLSITKTAAMLGVSQCHLSLVLRGLRQSKRLMKRYNEFQKSNFVRQ